MEINEGCAATWKTFTVGDTIPEKAVVIGHDNYENDVYLARFLYSNLYNYGNYPAGYEKGYFEYGGQCRSDNNMELLVIL